MFIQLCNLAMQYLQMKIDYARLGYCIVILKNSILVKQMTHTVVIILESCLHFTVKIQLLDLCLKSQEPLNCFANAVLLSRRCKTIVIYSPFQLLKSQVYIDFFCHNEYADRV